MLIGIWSLSTIRPVSSNDFKVNRFVITYINLEPNVSVYAWVSTTESIMSTNVKSTIAAGAISTIGYGNISYISIVIYQIIWCNY